MRPEKNKQPADADRDPDAQTIGVSRNPIQGRGHPPEENEFGDRLLPVDLPGVSKSADDKNRQQDHRQQIGRATVCDCIGWRSTVDQRPRRSTGWWRRGSSSRAMRRCAT